MNKIKEVLTNKHARTIYWSTAVGFIPLFIGVLTVIQPDVVNPVGIALISLAIGMLNTLSKYINKQYLS